MIQQMEMNYVIYFTTTTTAITTLLYIQIHICMSEFSQFCRYFFKHNRC